MHSSVITQLGMSNRVKKYVHIKYHMRSNGVGIGQMRSLYFNEGKIK